MTMIAWLFLACGSAPETPAPAPEPSTPGAPAAAAPEPAPAVDLRLTDATRSRLAKVAQAKGGPALCEAIPEVEALRIELDTQLNDAWGALPDEPMAGESLDAAIDALALPEKGFIARRRAEGVRVDIDYTGLGRSAGVDTALLTAAQPFLATGFAPYMMQETDITGCIEPMAAKRPLLALQRSWADAEPCLKDLLRDQLINRISPLGRVACYCQSEAQTLEDIAAMKPVLAQLTDLQGPATWAGLDATAKSERASFGGHGCG